MFNQVIDADKRRRRFFEANIDRKSRTSMLDLEEQKANESEAAREEKDKNPDEIEVEPILDTEQDDESGNPIVTLMYD
ncbi:hypothetical protein PENSUB_1627 [Penicillium subrubescens]|uniref:Uncharacterized protein n=1 Tax=Penicillium subrubescens TaxID=1316194 RepID=A0A1Q5URW2_9EURO|nr:hypothetical protein PENSUB_1627 [Penicillium subrubescens]